MRVLRGNLSLLPGVPESLVGEAHEPHAGEAKPHRVLGEGRDDVFVMIKVDFLLDFPEPGGLASLFNEAVFIEKKVRMEQTDEGIEDSQPVGKGALKDKAVVLLLFDSETIRDGLLQGKIGHGIMDSKINLHFL